MRPHSQFSTGLYAQAWKELKSRHAVSITVLNPLAVARVTRGIGQLKHHDAEWRSQGSNNLLRLRTTTTPQSNSQVVILMELLPSNRYRQNTGVL